MNPLMLSLNKCLNECKAMARTKNKNKRKTENFYQKNLKKLEHIVNDESVPLAEKEAIASVLGVTIRNRNPYTS